MNLPSEDYVPEEEAGQKDWEDGTYTVEGVTWTTIDEAGDPILTELRGRPIARWNFILKDDVMGPPFSATLGDIYRTTLALNLAVPRTAEVVPANAGAVTAYLKAVEEAINQIKEPWTITTSRGWANSIFDVVFPEGTWYCRLIDTFPKEKGTGKPYAKAGEWGPYFTAKFAIEAGEGGMFTPFQGCEFIDHHGYAVEIKDGTAVLSTGASGGFTPEAYRLGRLFSTTAPQVFPAGQEINFPDPNAVLEYWYSVASVTGALLKIIRLRNQRSKIKNARYEVPPLEIQEVIKASVPVAPAPWEKEEPEATTPVARPEVKPPPEEPASESKPEPEPQPKNKLGPQVDEEEKRSKAVGIMVDAIGVCAGEEAFHPDLTLTEAGKNFAQTQLAVLATSGKLSTTVLADLSYEEVEEVLEHLKESFEQVATGALAALALVGVRLDDTEESVAEPTRPNPFV